MLLNAFDHATTILHWFENRPAKETPPRWMWHLDWEVEAFFKQVEADRQNERAAPPDDEPAAQMMDNALAKKR